jgi:hypothetical protein
MDGVVCERRSLDANLSMFALGICIAIVEEVVLRWRDVSGHSFSVSEYGVPFEPKTYVCAPQC